VLQQYLGNNFIDKDFIDYLDEDITSTVSERTKTNIKKLLKYELDHNLKTVSETKDFSKIVVSDELPDNVDTANLVPENFDSRTMEEPYIENNVASNNTNDTETQYEEVNNTNDTETQYEEVNNTNDTETKYEEIAAPIIKKESSLTKENQVNTDSDSESDTETVIETMSILKDTTSVETNLVNNFSFFEDAADF
jgi:hypothetical protein